MIFPIGDDQIHKGHFPLFSYGFIALNVLVFVFEVLLDPTTQQQFVFEYGCIPVEIMNGQDYFTLFTCMFLHGGWMHLIGNMLFLWVFADNIEATIGNFRFVFFYIAGGLAASFAHIYFYPMSEIPTVGASGAISAVLGAYLVMFPTSRVKILVFFFTSFRVIAVVFLGFWIAQQLISGYAAISAPTADTDGVAWWAHIGGFAFGLLAGLFYRFRFPNPQLIRAED